MCIETSKTDAAPAARQVYGTFYLNGDEFAIEMSDLQEVVPAPSRLQRMPRAPKYLLGLFNLRGRVLPVISMSPCWNPMCRKRPSRQARGWSSCAGERRRWA